MTKKPIPVDVSTEEDAAHKVLPAKALGEACGVDADALKPASLLDQTASLVP